MPKFWFRWVVLSISNKVIIIFVLASLSIATLNQVPNVPLACECGKRLVRNRGSRLAQKRVGFISYHMDRKWKVEMHERRFNNVKQLQWKFQCSKIITS